RARREAAADARRRAAEYATALGLELGPVAWIAEPGLRAGGGAPHRVGWSAVANFARASAAETDEPVEIAPGEITVTAAVEVGFEIA
ncbi:MAG: SIMPL domain-containing protein, partial [Acidimicrobiales bacterium]